MATKDSSTMNSYTSVSISTSTYTQDISGELSAVVSKRRAVSMETDGEGAGEVFTVSQDFKADDADAVTVHRGEKVVLVETKGKDPSKRVRFDFEEVDLGVEVEDLLDTSAARHKMAVRPKRNHTPTSRWKVQSLEDPRRQGWVPIVVLTPHEESPERLSKQDVIYRREAVISELVETEEEFCRDLLQVVDRYLRPLDGNSVPRNVSDNKELLFGNFKEIAIFHHTVLLEGIKYYSNDPKSLGRAFLRMERDFDKHVAYCHDEPAAQDFLQNNDNVRDFFDDLGARLHDDKTLSEHLKLPIQRINDYQLLLKELVKYSERLGEDTTDLNKALELMLGIPHRADDLKFISNIEGYHGDIYKLGRLLRHNWFRVTGKDGKTHERYLFLFKARILVCKVRKIAEDRYVFVLKEIIRLPEVEVKDHKYDPKVFEVGPYTLTSHKDHVKEPWLAEIKHYARNALTLAEHAADDLRLQEAGNKNLEPLKGVELETPAHSLSNSDEEMDKLSANRRTSLSRRVEELRSSSITESTVHISTSTVLMEMSTETTLDTVDTTSRCITDSHLFSKTIEGLNVQPGDCAAFECEVDAESVFWLKDNKPISDRLSDRITQMSVGNLHRLEILNVSESDAGVYTAHARTASGEVSTCTANLVVQRMSDEERRARAEANAPIFMVKLKDTELLKDTYLRFMVKVKGNPNPEVKFYKDEELITYENEHMAVISDKGDAGYYELVIPEVKRTDAGVFKCIAINKFGEATCEGVVTIVDTMHSPSPRSPSPESKKILLPSKPPEEKNVFEGLDETKEVPPSSTEPEFLWLKNGQPFNPEERFKVLFQEQEDSLALVFTHVKPEDAGLYTCVASTQTGKISCSAELTVQGNVNLLFREPEPPKIKVTHKEIVANIGSSAMLETKITGYPKPEVKWFKNDEEVVMTDRIRVLYEDEETISLVIKTVKMEDCGDYKAMSINCAGQAEDTVSLAIKAPPTFSQKLRDVKTIAGEELKLTVQVEANPKPTVLWYRDGKELSDNDHIKIIEDGTSYTMFIEKCTLFDIGSYSVICKNEISQSSEFCKVEIEGAPIFTRNLIKKVDLEEGDALAFLVKVFGNPMPSVKWLFKGQPVIADQRCKICNDVDTFTLTVNAIKREDAGEYSCQLMNAHGINIDHGCVFVKCSPKFIKPLGNLVAQESDENVGFLVDIESHPKGKVRWFHNEKEITESHDEYTFKEEENSYSLVIKNVTREDAGKYNCRIENEYGSEDSFAELTVLCKPQFKKGLAENVSVDEGDSLTLQIEIDATPEPQIKWYKDGQEVTSDAHIKITRDSQRIETFGLTVDLVRAEDSGEYEVRALNEMGAAILKTKVVVQTRSSEENWTTEVGKEETKTDTQYHLGEDLEKKKKEVDEIKLQNRSEEDLIQPIKGEISQGLYEEKTIYIQTINDEERDVFVENSEKNFSCVEVKIDSQSYEVVTGLVEEFSDSEEKSAKLSVSRGVSIVSISEDEDVKETHSTKAESDEPSKLNNRAYIETILHDDNLKGEAYLPVEKSFDGKIGYLSDIKIAEIDDSQSFTVSINGNKEIPLTGERKLEQERLNFKDSTLESSRKIKMESPQGNMSIKKGILDSSKLKREKAEIADPNSDNETVFTQVQSLEIDGVPHRISLREDSKLNDHGELPISSNSEISDGSNSQSVSNVPETVTVLPEKFDLADDDVDSLLKKAQQQRNALDDILRKQGGLIRQAAPQITKSHMKDTEVFETWENTFAIEATGVPRPEAKWYKDEKEITGSEKFVITDSGENYKLELLDCQLEDAGQYKVVVSNVLGQASDSAQFKVRSAQDFRLPQIQTPLIAKDVHKNNTAVLTVVLTADPIPEIKWTHDGKDVDAEFIQNCETKKIHHDLKECTYTLTITSSKHVDTGTYHFHAANKSGEADCSARLDIILMPEVEVFKDATGIPYEEAEFVAIIHSNPRAEITWRKDGNKVTSSDHIEITTDHVNEIYKLRVKDILLEDAGVYTISAVNNLGEISADAKLRIHMEEPIFTKGLENVTVREYAELDMKVRAEGVPKPEIRWSKDGVDLVETEGMTLETRCEGQVSSHLIIPHFKPEHAGTSRHRNVCSSTDNDDHHDDLFSKYKVRAYSVAGYVDSVCAVKLAMLAPTFSKALERAAQVEEGEPLELRCKVEASSLATVKWMKNGEELTGTDHVKLSYTPDGFIKLRIEQVTPEDCGAYKLIVENTLGKETSICAVAVIPSPRRPVFIKRLQDVVLTEGEQLLLEAKVMAFPLPELKWFKDGLPVRQSRTINFINSPGGTVGLCIDNVTPEHAGAYSLIVINKLGEASSDAKVEVVMKDRMPEFQAHLSPLTVVEGFPAKFSVKVGGNPLPKLAWLQNGAPIDIDGCHIKILESPNGTQSLVIDKATPSDSGVFTVTASNPAGSISSQAKLIVSDQVRPDMPEEKPDFAHALRDAWAEEGSQLTFSVPFAGNPVPEISWFKNGIKITPDQRITLINDGNKISLQINPCDMNDVGVYKCKLTNQLGEAESEAKASIKKIFHAPIFSQKLHHLEQVIGLDGKFICRVNGNPRPEVLWYKDDKPLYESNKYHIKRDGDSCLLYIRECDPDDDGVFKCVATNRDGKDECEAKFKAVEKILTRDKGEAPCFLKKIGDQEIINGITGRFTACISGFPEPEIEWFRNNDRLYPSERITMERESTGLIRLSIAKIDVDLDCGLYKLRICNDFGEDECEASFIHDSMGLGQRRPVGEQYKDFEDFKHTGAPLPLPDRPIISKMTDGRLTLSWRPSIPIGPRDPVTYQVEMCELPHGDWITVRSGIRSCSCEIRNLERYKDYKFRVRVENKYGVSDPSPFAITFRSKLEPEPPKFIPYLAPGIDFRPETSIHFPKDFDIERPPHDGYAQAPRFLRQEQYTQYGIKGHNSNLFWFVYGYPKPKMTYTFNDELIEMGGRYDASYTRNGQATLFINKMLERDVGTYEAIAVNEHGEARQRVHLQIAEHPEFNRRLDEMTIYMRQGGRLEARVTGVPPPEIKWYKDWQPLAHSSRFKINRVDPDHCYLSINDAICKDAGLYSISASNVAGTITCSVMVHVEERDEHPFHLYGRGHNISPKTKLLKDLYDLGDELGRGTQGVSYHAVERVSGRNYAAKIMHGRGELKAFMNNELEIMNQLNSHKLIKIHDAFETLDSMILITELAGGGELLDCLTKQPYTTESEIASYIRQLLCGLDCMHEQNIAHLGLTPGDLLISHPGSDDLKVCDFGLSRRIHPGQLAHLDYGMPEFVSPEIIKGEGVDLNSDLWSVGAITHLLLTGVSLFRGNNDMETLTKVREGFWEFDEDLWCNLSMTARDFISKLLVVDAYGRMDVKSALRHPWLNLADRLPPSDFTISTQALLDYYNLWKDWYSNASCRNWYRRRPLIGAFTHPSHMVYPPNYIATPTESPEREVKEKTKTSWIEQLPSRQPLNYDMEVVSSESHYQNGPDTYLLQLRDVDFPVRIREYMKVAANRQSGMSRFSDDSHLDLRLPVIRERRRFTDVMDEEIDDERKLRINQYGLRDSYTVRRLKHELGTRLDTHVEAEALIEATREGQAPFMREKPQITPIEENKNAELVCYAVGEPKPTIQWFKNEMMIGSTNRVKIVEDDKGRSLLQFQPATATDAGIYKVVARNRLGQTVSRTRVVLACVPDAPDSPQESGVSDHEVLLRWKQPKFDGNSPVFCYCVQYKSVDGPEWKDANSSVDHEFYLVRGLHPATGYIFRLAAQNAIGWSPKGIPTEEIRTLEEGCPPIEMSRTMRHLQSITDSGHEIIEEAKEELDYNVESSPIEWSKHNPTEKYNFISEIYRGRFSVVVKAIDKTCDKVVVGKLLEYSSSTEPKVNAEFESLRSLRHERIASLMEAYKPLDATYCVFILEKLQGADVLTYLASRHEYTEQMVATIITQVLDALQYLHWRGVCHLDIQPDNVVMASVRSTQIKLVDLGCAQKVTKLGNVVKSLGSLEFSAPEVLCQEPAYPQSDIWSVGVLTYVLLSGVSPFLGATPAETRQNINFVRFRFEYLYKELTQEGTRFVMLVFKRAPNKRPSVEECHEHRWLLPTDYMIKRRERAVFLGNRLKDFCDNYHKARDEEASTLEALTCLVSGKGPLMRSSSIIEELKTTE